jgi:Uncharacterized conserved protein (DUF2190)
MPATQNVVLSKGYDAGGAITKKRFVKLSGEQQVVQCAVAGELAIGVSLFSVSAAEILKGKGASVLEMGRAIVEAGAAISVGAKVATDNQGRAVTSAAGNTVLGVCEKGAGAAGSECTVRLTSMAIQ